MLMYMTSLVSDLLWGSSNTSWNNTIPMGVGFPAHKLSVQLKQWGYSLGGGGSFVLMGGAFLGEYCIAGNFRWCKF